MITDAAWPGRLPATIHMGIAGDLVDKYGISREAQDAFAAASQQKAVAAIEAGVLSTKSPRSLIPQRKATRSLRHR